MKDTLIRELIDSGKYGEFADYFWTYITDDHLDCPLSNYGYEACGFEEALERCRELAGKGKHIYSIYSRQEEYQRHELQEAKLIFFPRSCETELTKETGKAFALVIPGGGFARQWTLIEGYAIAARLNKLGISAFVLLYRTAQDGVVYKALSDVKRAVSFICKNAASFDVSATSYIMGGFSAGATLAGLMATDNLGYKAASALVSGTESAGGDGAESQGTTPLSLPRPELIFLGYPAQKMDLFYGAWAKAPEGSDSRSGSEAFLRRLVKPGASSASGASDTSGASKFHITEADIAPLIIEDHISHDTCPPLFITACEDDPVVPFINSKSLYEKAKSLGIPVAARFGATGGHSFGLGCGLEVDGWHEEAINFWRSNRQ